MSANGAVPNGAEREASFPPANCRLTAHRLRYTNLGQHAHTWTIHINELPLHLG